MNRDVASRRLLSVDGPATGKPGSCPRRLTVQSVECPEEYMGAGKELSLFLGGGITGCPDWQAHMLRKLEKTRLVLLSPRRQAWPMNQPEASEAQIRWEHTHLLRAD